MTTKFKIHDITPYCQPGIFRVDCKSTNCSLFGESANVYWSMREIKNKLNDGSFENEQVLKDFNLYGLKNFKFVIVAAGPQWLDLDKRKNVLQELKSSWALTLY